jgi:AcrR family transcriptional regulator
MSRARQEKQSEEVRGRILDIARRIIAEEGVGALSIRRITKEMDYSAGIVYHYFESKDDILAWVLRENYQMIMNAIKPKSQNMPPDDEIRTSIISYIETALQWHNEYCAVMLDSSPQVLAFTSMLGDNETRPALAAMVVALEKGVEDGMFSPCDTQITARAIWSAIFGLLIRLIVEGDVPKEQRAALIECQTKILINGLKP